MKLLIARFIVPGLLAASFGTVVGQTAARPLPSDACRAEVQAAPGTPEHTQEYRNCIARRLQQLGAERTAAYERRPGAPSAADAEVATRIARELPAPADGPAIEQRVLCRRNEAVSYVNGKPALGANMVEEGLAQALFRYATEPRVWQVVEAWGRLNLAKGYSLEQCESINQFQAMYRLNEAFGLPRHDGRGYGFIRQVPLTAIREAEARVLKPMQQAAAASAAAARELRQRNTGPEGDTR